jgi:hypothetical protein
MIYFKAFYFGKNPFPNILERFSKSILIQSNISLCIPPNNIPQFLILDFYFIIRYYHNIDKIKKIGLDKPI